MIILSVKFVLRFKLICQLNSITDIHQVSVGYQMVTSVLVSIGAGKSVVMINSANVLWWNYDNCKKQSFPIHSDCTVCKRAACCQQHTHTRNMHSSNVSATRMLLRPFARFNFRAPIRCKHARRLPWLRSQSRIAISGSLWPPIRCSYRKAGPIGSCRAALRQYRSSGITGKQDAEIGSAAAAIVALTVRALLDCSKETTGRANKEIESSMILLVRHSERRDF